MTKRSEDPLTQSNSSKKTKSSDTNINKDEDHLNRGVELILTGGKRKQTQPFHIIFEKIVCFLNREVTIYFEFSLKSRKKTVVSRRKRNVSN
jgi:Fe-S cluster assembly ATPase SufC